MNEWMNEWMNEVRNIQTSENQVSRYPFLESKSINDMFIFLIKFYFREKGTMWVIVLKWDKLRTT